MAGVIIINRKVVWCSLPLEEAERIDATDEPDTLDPEIAGRRQDVPGPLQIDVHDLLGSFAWSAKQCGGMEDRITAAHARAKTVCLQNIQPVEKVVRDHGVAGVAELADHCSAN